MTPLLAASWPPIAAAPIVGSFLGVVIRRLPARQPIVADRSRCDACGATLGPGDLVPLVSWLATGGKCRHCGQRIGLFYPLVELSALAVALSAALVAAGPALWLDCAIGWTLLTLSWIDAEHFLLPRALTWPLLLAGLAAAALQGRDALTDAAIGAALGYLSLRAIGWAYRKFRGRDGLGLGDADLLAAAGAWLGWALLPSVIALAAGAGLIAALAASLGGRKLTAATAIPFGPFLAVAFWGLLLTTGIEG
jgi:leader peptidase (prepilin peptidase)/N-methyltransferase